MAQLSPKVKEKNGAKWCEALAPDLLHGETIWALVSAARIRPVTSGAAITNARVVGFWHGGRSTDKRILLEVFADRMRGIDFPVKAGNTSMRIRTDQGEVNFGNLHTDEVDFARYFIDYLARNGVDPTVAQAVKQKNQEQMESEVGEAQRIQRRDHVEVFGRSMKDKWWDAVDRHAHDGELPWFIINGGVDGRLFAFEDRLVISKTGGMTGFMAGAAGGGRETVFHYTDITNIEYNSGFVNGVLEVLTPSYQGTANHDFWNTSRNGTRNPHELSNCLPLPKALYQQVQPKINLNLS